MDSAVQLAEDGRGDAGGIHSRQAHPLHAPAQRHERSPFAIGDKAVVGIGWESTVHQLELGASAGQLALIQLHTCNAGRAIAAVS